MTDHGDDLLSQRMAAYLLRNQPMTRTVLLWAGEHLIRYLPPSTARVLRDASRRAQRQPTSTGWAVASVRRSLSEAEHQGDVVDQLARSVATWAEPDSPAVRAWFAAIGAADRLWLLAVQRDVARHVPALLPLIGVFPWSEDEAPRQAVEAAMPSSAAFMTAGQPLRPKEPGADQGKAVDVVTGVLFPDLALAWDRKHRKAPRSLPPMSETATAARTLLADWIERISAPLTPAQMSNGAPVPLTAYHLTLARAVTCGLVQMDAATVTIRTGNLVEAVQAIDQQIRAGGKLLLVQACRWRLRDRKVAVDGSAKTNPHGTGPWLGRSAIQCGGYVTHTFGHTPELRLDDRSMAPGRGPRRCVIDQLTQVDLLARHTQQYTLLDPEGEQMGLVAPTPRWLFEDSHAERSIAEASGSRLLASQKPWVATTVPKAQRPAKAPGWAPATATLVEYVRNATLRLRKQRREYQPTDAVKLADLIASTACEVLLPDDFQAVALFDYRLGVTVPMEAQKSRPKT